jgi:hypothetical protein
MGWNTGYTIFEATVVGSYDLGKLDKPLLSVLMAPYRGSDIDSSGSADLTTHDGKDVRQVVIETWGLEMPQPPPGTFDDDPDTWDKYQEQTDAQMRIVTDAFGWA